MWGVHTSSPVDAVQPPKEVYNWRVYIIALVSSMGAVLFGYDLAFIGTAITLEPFLKDFGLADSNASKLDAFSANIVSLLQAGCFFGALAAAPLGDKLGKKITLILAGILFSMGSILQVASMGNTAVMFLGRVIGGLGVGSASMLVPPYIAEVSPPSIRGRLVGIYELGVQAGTCIGFWINYGVTINVAPTSTQWRIPFAIQLIPGGILIIGMFFLPESPRWLANFRSHELGITMLAKLRNLPVDNKYVVHEMLAITKQIEQERFITKGSGFIADLREIALPGNRNRIALGIAIFIFMQMAGSNAINYYSPRIFKSIGLSGQNTGLISTGVYGIVRMVAVVIAMYWVVDRFGRTKMLIYGSAVSAFTMWFLGAFVKINPATTDSTVSQPHISAGGYTAAVMIYIYAVGFCFSWAGIPWIYASEIFPLRIRSICMAICTATHWLMNFVIARSTPYMIRNIKFGTYFVFAASLTLAIPFVYFFLPETKGLSLEDMDRLFGVARKDSRLSISDHEKGNVQIENKEEKVASNGI